MAEARGTYREQEKCVQGFWWRNLRVRQLGIPRHLMRIILKLIFKKWDYSSSG